MLADVPVPRGAAPIRPTLQLLSRPEIASDATLSELLDRLEPSSTPRAAA